MLTRRLFTALLLAAPIVLRAETEDVAVVIAAPRGSGLDRPANIKSCSKSLVTLLLGFAIAWGEIPSVDATLAEVAQGILPERATPGLA